MPEVFVMCPDCDLRARLTGPGGQLADYRGECQRKIHPAKCPVIGASITVIRKVLKQGWNPA
jgi:hypothetical protein